MSRSHSNNAAWGVSLVGDELRLVRVVRSGSGVRVDQTHRASAGDLSTLPTIPAGEPIALAISDEMLLYRRIAPPSVNPEMMDQVIATQAESILPLELERCAWGWGRTADGAVLICGGRREVVSQASDAIASLGEPTAVVPAAVALASVWGAGSIENEADEGSSAVGWANGDTISLAVLGRQGLAGVDVLEADTPAPAAIAALAQTAGLSPPRRATIIDGDQARAPGQLTPIPWPDALSPAEPADALALGAAAHHLLGATPAINLAANAAATADADAATKPTGPNWSRLVLVAVWAIAVIAGLYLMDQREAQRLDASITALQQQVRDANVNQRLALLGYLEQDTTPPLPLLEAISDAAGDRVVLSGLQYDRGGSVRFSGVAPSANQLDATLTRLSDSPVFDNVALRTVTPDRNSRSFEAEIDAQPLFRYLAMPMPTEDASDDESESDPDAEMTDEQADDGSEANPGNEAEPGEDSDEPTIADANGAASDDPEADADSEAEPSDASATAETETDAELFPTDGLDAEEADAGDNGPASEDNTADDAASGLDSVLEGSDADSAVNTPREREGNS